MTAMSGGFADRLLHAVDRAGGSACVGVDPVFERLPNAVRERTSSRAEAIERFSMDVVDVVASVAPVVKLQSACYERLGWEGLAALERVARAARERGLIVILDAKRCDIALTASHYAAWAFDEVGADAITLSPYMGADSIEPFLEPRWSAARPRGVFVLVRTSNPSARDLQSVRTDDGRSVAHVAADLVARLGKNRCGERGWSDVGAVVAATAPDEAASLRQRMPEQIFLAPGFGAQGGTAQSVRPLFNAKGEGVLITASRSVIYAFDTRDARWRESVHQAAIQLVEQARQAATRQ